MSRRVRVRRRAPEVVEHVGGSLTAPLPLRTWTVMALLVAASGGVAVATRMADVDDDVGVWAGVVYADASRIRWALVPAIAALTTVHYLASAFGVRAAAEGVADRRCGLWEMTAAQFAGAAANRLTTCGLGSAAVTCRYLTRRGLAAGVAAAAVAVSGLLRGLTKLILCAPAVVMWNDAGRLMHGSGPHRLLTRHSGLVLPAAVAAGCAATAVLLVSLGRRRGRVRATAADVVRSLWRLARRPRCLLASLAASAGAHVALTLAFTVSVVAVTGAGTRALGALPAVYLLGATVGATIPTPAGVGSTEAALVAALAVAHVPVAQATQGVLLFRAMTFWAPVPVGVAGLRRLRRQGAL